MATTGKSEKVNTFKQSFLSTNNILPEMEVNIESNQTLSKRINPNLRKRSGVETSTQRKAIVSTKLCCILNNKKRGSRIFPIILNRF